MRRRQALIKLAAIALSSAALRVAGQVNRRPYRIGLLPELDEYNQELFVRALGEQDWVNGRDFVLVEPEAALQPRMVPSATRRSSEDIASVTKLLVERKPDLILATSTAYALAVRRLSESVPVVMWTSGYPVEAGVAEKLARPGKNVTGNTIYAGTGVWGKLVELLHEAKPSIRRVVVLWDYAPSAFTREEIAPAHIELANAAARLQLGLEIMEIAGSDQAEQALAVLERQAVDGLIVTSGWGLSQVRPQVMRFATDRRIPVIVDFRWPQNVEPYPLLVYGAPQSELMQAAAQYAVRILAGASAAELPINQPRRFELLLNLKTASALQLKIPEMLRLRAQEVVE
jgi:putative ABC transport system substrate-binding protein